MKTIKRKTIFCAIWGAGYENDCFCGLSDMLKANKEFHNLCKQMYLKYNVFSKIPPEYQLCILMSTSAYICINKNKNKDSLEAYLNEPVEIPTNK